MRTFSGNGCNPAYDYYIDYSDGRSGFCPFFGTHHRSTSFEGDVSHIFMGDFKFCMRKSREKQWRNIGSIFTRLFFEKRYYYWV